MSLPRNLVPSTQEELKAASKFGKIWITFFRMSIKFRRLLSNAFPRTEKLNTLKL